MQRNGSLAGRRWRPLQNSFRAFRCTSRGAKTRSMSEGVMPHSSKPTRSELADVQSKKQQVAIPRKDARYCRVLFKFVRYGCSGVWMGGAQWSWLPQTRCRRTGRSNSIRLDRRGPSGLTPPSPLSKCILSFRHWFRFPA